MAIGLHYARRYAIAALLILGAAAVALAAAVIAIAVLINQPDHASVPASGARDALVWRTS